MLEIDKKYIKTKFAIAPYVNVDHISWTHFNNDNVTVKLHIGSKQIEHRMDKVDLDTIIVNWLRCVV